jgi:hypothetical protein
VSRLRLETRISGVTCLPVCSVDAAKWIDPEDGGDKLLRNVGLHTRRYVPEDGSIQNYRRENFQNVCFPGCDTVWSGSLVTNMLRHSAAFILMLDAEVWRQQFTSCPRRVWHQPGVEPEPLFSTANLREPARLGTRLREGQCLIQSATSAAMRP